MSESELDREVRHHVGAMLRAKRYDEVVRLLGSLQRSLTSAELVLKGRAIQLSSGRDTQLDEAESAFKEALALDEGYVPALLELGWCFFAAADDPQEGLLYFRRAFALSERAVEEAAEGVSRCLEELKEASP